MEFFWASRERWEPSTGSRTSDSHSHCCSSCCDNGRFWNSSFMRIYTHPSLFYDSLGSQIGAYIEVFLYLDTIKAICTSQVYDLVYSTVLNLKPCSISTEGHTMCRCTQCDKFCMLRVVSRRVIVG